MSKEVITNSIFRNELPGTFPIENPTTTLPGRKNVRISLTPRCNLQCGHCHNEGQSQPWSEELRKHEMSVDTVEQIVTIAQHFGVKTVKLTGGDFGVYQHMEDLLSRLANEWQKSIGKLSWGANTNGLFLMNTKKMAMIAESPLTKITFGIDSLIPGEKSKPSSPIGIESRRLFNSVVIPLSKEWKKSNKKILIDTVYTGNDQRILSIIEEGLKHGIEADIIEINGVMGTRYQTRQHFLELVNKIADLFDLEARFYSFLNQVYLYESSQTDSEKPKVKFFQDHCADLDCGNCRKIHMRVVSKEGEACTVPCFLQDQGQFMPLTKDGKVDLELFRTAIPKLSIGPDWRKKH